MEQLGKALSRVSDSLASRRSSGPEVPAARVDPNNLPAPYDRDVDLLIPRAVWCAHKIDGEPRRLRRALTVTERQSLERRIGELEPALKPYLPAEVDEVALALSDMLAGFAGSQRSGMDVVGKVDGLRRLLAQFPMWAVREACLRMRMDGYEVQDGNGGKRKERHWAPADGEVIEAVRAVVRQRAEALASARALLIAEVDG